MTATPVNVYAGIDTHQATNHVGIINEVGKKLGDRGFPTTSNGYQALLDFIASFGTIFAVRIEGTASYGAGITAYLRTQSVLVKEVTPKRQVHLAQNKVAADSTPEALLLWTLGCSPLASALASES